MTKQDKSGQDNDETKTRQEQRHGKKDKDAKTRQSND